jgi:hypothetical protein
MAMLALPTVARCDSLNTVAYELRSLVDIPFRFGVARDLASNILTAQTLVSYASPESLELSIESVVRAIGIDELTFHSGYVGFANVDPITWLSSTIAIDPGATIVITPDALDFGEAPVATPEPAGWILMLIGLAAVVTRKVFSPLFIHQFAEIYTRAIWIAVRQFQHPDPSVVENSTSAVDYGYLFNISE